MTDQPSHCRSVTITAQNRGGTIYVSSDDIEGLWLWGRDPTQLLDSIAPAIQALFKHNHGLDVTVVGPKDPNGWLSRIGRSLTDASAPANQTDTLEICPITETDLNRLHG
jgi:hypothetical protein